MSGVRRWASALSPEEVRAEAEEAGQAFGYVDTPGTRAEALAAIGAALDFPAYYGQNLDALHDCLRDLPGPTVLLWDGWADAPELAGVVEVLEEHADRLTVLLRATPPAG